jgi:hypothetical protein
VSAFNTVVTYDLYQDYIKGDADPRNYISSAGLRLSPVC